jgi:hypothetical protein
MNRYTGMQAQKISPSKVRSDGDVAMGAFQMGATGAQLGMQVGGPWGAAIGAGVGAIGGLVAGGIGRSNERATRSAQEAYNKSADFVNSKKADSEIVTQAQAKHGLKKTKGRYAFNEEKLVRTEAGEVIVEEDGSFHDTTKPGTSHEGVEDVRKVTSQREASKDPKNTIPEGGAVIPAQSNPSKYARLIALAKSAKYGNVEAGKEIRKEVSKLPKDK